MPEVVQEDQGGRWKGYDKANYGNKRLCRYSHCSKIEVPCFANSLNDGNYCLVVIQYCFYTLMGSMKS